MRASFDGVRRNLASDFNALAKTELNSDQKCILNNIRSSIVGLLCMYQDEDPDGDCNCLIESVPLEEIFKE